MLENPYAVLEIEVGATLAQVQAAYRRLAKDCHPDRQPDDPRAAEKFRAITEARDAILEIKRRGPRRSGIDAPPPRSGPSWTLWEVTAPAGAGKTREWARGVAQQPDRRRMNDPTAVVSTIWPLRRPLRIVLASVTIDLLMETAKALAEFRAGNVIVIHSRIEASGQTVNQKLGKYFGDLGNAKKAGQFIWTAPLDRPGSSHGVASTFFEPARRGGYQAFHLSMRLPSRTHGLNKFRKYDNAALLSVTNFTPA